MHPGGLKAGSLAEQGLYQCCSGHNVGEGPGAERSPEGLCTGVGRADADDIGALH